MAETRPFYLRGIRGRMSSGPVPTGATVGRIDSCSQSINTRHSDCLAKQRESIDLVRPHGIMRPAQLSLAFFGLCLLTACAAPLAVSTEDLSRMQECKAGFGSSSQTVGQECGSSGSRSAAREHPGKAPHGARTVAPDRVSGEARVRLPPPQPP